MLRGGSKPKLSSVRSSSQECPISSCRFSNKAYQRNFLLSSNNDWAVIYLIGFRAVCSPLLELYIYSRNDFQEILKNYNLSRQRNSKFLFFSNVVANHRSFETSQCYKNVRRKGTETFLINQLITMSSVTLSYSSEDSIDGVPPEILMQVFEHVYTKNLLTARRVCKYWKDVIEELPIKCALKYAPHDRSNRIWWSNVFFKTMRTLGKRLFILYQMLPKYWSTRLIADKRIRRASGSLVVVTTSSRNHITL